MDAPLPSATSGADVKYRLLLEISQQISRTIDLQDVLNHLLQSVRSVVHCDAAGIFVLNRSVPYGMGGGGPNLIAGMAAFGFQSLAEGRDPMLRSGKGIVGHVIRSGETVIASDVALDPHYVEGRPETRSEMAVPIVSNAEVIGALNLESNRLAAFSAADAELLEAFAVAAAISIEKAVLHREVIEKHRIEQQLRLAREVQAGLLPTSAPVVPGYDIAGLNLPASDIGGDYFDYFPLPDGRLGLVIADVSGKGVPAALLMATFRAVVRSEVRKNPPIPALIADVHGTLIESMDPWRFVSTVYGVLDPDAGTFAYVNCGHNPPMLLRANGDRELLPSGRPALGMFGAQPVEATTVLLGAGDTLLLYTDGVVESTGANLDDVFGEDRLGRTLADSAILPARRIIRALVDATRAFAGRDVYDDDFTLVVVKREARASSENP
jgi:serine phosphatase RsbU (regulator of sigma subunit)